MTNEELKKKIVEIIDEWANNAIKAKRSGASVYDPYNGAELADALIAAGIGDIQDIREKANLDISGTTSNPTQYTGAPADPQEPKIKKWYRNTVGHEPANYDAAALKAYIAHLEAENAELQETEACSIADALIAAGIGDVSELKKHRVVIEKSLIPEDDNAYVLPNIPPTVKQLYSGEEVEQIVKEREEYKHRAARAERALDKAVELAYEFRTESDTLSCSSCPMFSIFDRCKDRGLYEECSKRWKEELLIQAEKELAEERKDD